MHATAFFPEWQLTVEARQIVRRHRIQLVHVNNVDLVKWLLPAARMARIPMVAHIHLPTARIERCYTWAHQVARVVAVSRSVAQEFLDDGLAPERVQVIYNAVDPERLNSGDARSLRPQLGIRPDEIVIVAVASLIHRKGYDLLLPAFTRVRRGRPGTRLVIVGDGPDRGALEALAAELGVADAVCFLGERQDAGAILRDVADIAVSTARHETFGLTLIEAALFALPVAASDIPPHREAVVDGETGLLAAQDPEAIAATLMRLLDDAPLATPFRRSRTRTCVSRVSDRPVRPGVPGRVRRPSCGSRRGRMDGGGNGRGQPPTRSGSRARFAGGWRSRRTMPVRGKTAMRVSAPPASSRNFLERLHVDAGVLSPEHWPTRTEKVVLNQAMLILAVRENQPHSAITGGRRIERREIGGVTASVAPKRRWGSRYAEQSGPVEVIVEGGLARRIVKDEEIAWFHEAGYVGDHLVPLLFGHRSIVAAELDGQHHYDDAHSRQSCRSFSCMSPRAPIR